MTTVLYCHTSSEGGAELAAPGLAEALGSQLWIRGNRSRVGSLARSRNVHVVELAAARDKRASSVRTWVSGIAGLVSVQFDVYRRLVREKPDLLISNSIQGLLHTAFPALLARTPLVAYVRDLGVGGNRPATEVWIYRQLLRSTAGVIYNSEITRRSWKTVKDDIVTSTAVGPIFFDRWSGRKSGQVVMVGRVAEWKGQAQVIEALNSLKADRDVSLVIVGGRLFADDYELPKAEFPVEATGHVPDPWKYLDDAALLVHASMPPEPFGQVVAQAAASGIPIICGDTGGQTEWLEHEVSALFVDPANPSAIAGAVEQVLDDWESALGRARAARKAAERFSEDKAYSGVTKWINLRWPRASIDSPSGNSSDIEQAGTQ
jgi:glycosyltransferase involved in cell wall biosynthesis